MVLRDDIINYIDGILGSGRISDSSQNGLQIEGKEKVCKAVFGVSANMEFFKKAAAAGADIVITHHGLLWSHNPRVTGIFKKRIEFLIKNNISLAAWHLPLDMHPVLGNNARIAKKLGLKKIEPFGAYHGVKIGFKGVLPVAVGPKDIEAKLGLKAKTVFNYGPSKIKTAAIVSGGGNGQLEEAVNGKADLFITGGSEEYAQEMCREGKINYIAFGHYDSETFGVKALMAEVAVKFGVKTEFIDVKNPI